MRLMILGLVASCAATCIDDRRRGEADGGPGAASADYRDVLVDYTGIKFRQRSPDHGPPRFFQVDYDVHITPEEFLQRHAVPLWDLSPADELRHTGTTASLNGYLHTSYRQFHGGHPIEGIEGWFVLTTLGGYITSCDGKPMGGLRGLPLEVRVSQALAIERGRASMAAACDLREPLKLWGDPTPRLVISHEDRRLVWRVDLEVTEPWVSWIVNVDPATGDVISEIDGRTSQFSKPSKPRCTPKKPGVVSDGSSL